MAVDLASFRIAFPEFKDTADDLIGRRLIDAQNIHRQKEYLTLLITAHLLSVESQTGSGTGGRLNVTGEISKVKIGPKETSYHAPSSATTTRANLDSSFWGTTLYGRMFLLEESRLAKVALSARVFGSAK